MPEPIFISPYDAAILGYCVGNYLKSADGFAYVCSQWLVPHYPVFDPQYTERTIPRADAPRDTQWWAGPDGDDAGSNAWGYAQSTPGTTYCARGDMVTATTCSYPRYSFPQSLALCLRDVLPFDVKLPWLLDAVVPATLRLYSHILPNVIQQLAKEWPCQQEQQEDVVRKVLDLVRYNECDAYYELGLAFGNLNLLRQGHRPRSTG